MPAPDKEPPQAAKRHQESTLVINGFKECIMGCLSNITVELEENQP